jgi:hypothetical protein
LILFVGDSLAVGTPLASVVHERVVKRAEVGIDSQGGWARFAHPLDDARVVVVSLGTNNWSRPDAVRSVAGKAQRSSTAHGFCLRWMQVSGVPNAHRINRIVRRQGITMVPWNCSCVHPSPRGYVRRANAIRKSIKSC